MEVKFYKKCDNGTLGISRKDNAVLQDSTKYRIWSLQDKKRPLRIAG